MKKDNLQPNSENDIKVSERVQRLTGEESTNKPDTNIPHPSDKLKCCICKEYKDKEHFYKSKTLSRGYEYRCKECSRERTLEYHYTNRNEQLLKFKKRNDSLSLEERAEKAINHKVWYKNTIQQRLLYRARERSKKLKLLCDLEISDIIIPDVCPLLNVPFQMGNKYEKWYTYSLDRIDNSKGYVKGNVHVITYLANTMKSKASKEELKAFALNILELLKDDDIV